MQLSKTTHIHKAVFTKFNLVECLYIKFCALVFTSNAGISIVAVEPALRMSSETEASWPKNSESFSLLKPP